MEGANRDTHSILVIGMYCLNFRVAKHPSSLSIRKCFILNGVSRENNVYCTSRVTKLLENPRLDSVDSGEPSTLNLNLIFNCYSGKYAGDGRSTKSR